MRKDAKSVSMIPLGFEPRISHLLQTEQRFRRVTGECDYHYTMESYMTNEGF